MKGSELCVVADGGEVWTASRFFGLLPRQNYELASAGGGVRLNFKGKTLVGLEAARTLTLPYAGTTRDWRFIISRSEEHTSELQSLMRISYAVFCLKKKKNYSSKSI